MCQQPSDGRSMIKCDICSNWYHLSCLGFDDQDIERLEEPSPWVCPACPEPIIDPALIIPPPSPLHVQEGRSPAEPRSREHPPALGWFPAEGEMEEDDVEE